MNAAATAPSAISNDPRLSEVLTDAMARTVAASAGVCTRPLLRKVIDRTTGAESIVPIPCGATRSSVCPVCADKARRLRMHQCKEGWHLTDDPLPTQNSREDRDELADEEDNEHDDPDGDTAQARRARSTRRREDTPNLPRIPAAHRTIGRTFTDPKTGKTYRPSMFITGTLPSYGLVRPGEGVPRNPAKYDYRRAALDALLFPRLIDRTIQNLRRCAGYKVQYFAAVEAQRRLAPHLHLAIRGTIPRQTVKQVFAASYVSIWWPPIDDVIYGSEDEDTFPVWTGNDTGYADPITGELLPTWDQALDALELDEPAKPFHTLQWGTQTDIKGLLGGTPDADKTVRYLCKYLTKAVSETYAPDQLEHADPNDPDHKAQTARYDAHLDALHTHARVLPCSPECANWLRYGTQPKNAGPGLQPGRCASKGHDRECAGIGGRRALVSRHWTGKTLTEHKQDRAAVVYAALDAAGIDHTQHDRYTADGETLEDGKPRFEWHWIDPTEHDYVQVIATSLRQANQWRTQYEHAKHALTHSKSPPTEPVHNHSATNSEARKVL